VVVIGRNEGERLERSLRSVRSDLHRVLYVDSGSSDGSVELGRRLASEVVTLDRSLPFTAARARSAGLKRLLELDGSVGLVQFVDGDCELEPGWLSRAQAALDRDPRLGAVCGRLRERHPDASPYARLSQMEWNRPAGETLVCGGIAMFRVAALNAVGGFRDSMIAGEEPELCYRLRRAGWRIERLNDAMGVHDGEMMRFRQWWLRAVRNGHAYAESAALNAADGGRGSLRPVASMLLWGLLAPLAAPGASPRLPRTLRSRAPLAIPFGPPLAHPSFLAQARGVSSARRPLRILLRPDQSPPLCRGVALLDRPSAAPAERADRVQGGGGEECPSVYPLIAAQNSAKA
jgi:GT2 family glycosyltransferase